MADVVDRRYPSGSSTGFDARYEKDQHRHGGTSYGTTGVGYNSRTSTDYDNAVVPYNPGVYRTYDLRAQYGSGEPRRLEVVKGNIFSVNQIYVTPPREAPYRPPLALPEPKDDTKARSTTWFNDPEMKRKRRVASYKAYSVEGKMKASLKKGFRWIRYKCSELIHGCSQGQPLDHLKIHSGTNLETIQWLMFLNCIVQGI